MNVLRCRSKAYTDMQRSMSFTGIERCQIETEEHHGELSPTCMLDPRVFPWLAVSELFKYITLIESNPFSRHVF